jgi:putative transposase
MPRVAREKSGSGIYHVILRGIDRNDIFHEDSDFELFLLSLKKAKEKDYFQLYAYCLMSNHIHLLIKEGLNNISVTMKRLSVSYAQNYNVKYERTGHVFQGRFRSETVESNGSFITVLRYIIQNPIKAGIVKNISDYKWSSATAYNPNNRQGIVDISFIRELFRSYKEFMGFLDEDTDEKCLDYRIRYTDSEITEMTIKLSNNRSILLLSKQEREQVVRNLRKITSANNSQISRATGLSRGILQRIK